MRVLLINPSYPFEEFPRLLVTLPYVASALRAVRRTSIVAPQDAHRPLAATGELITPHDGHLTDVGFLEALGIAR